MSRNSKNKAVKHQNEVRDLIRMVFCPPFREGDVVSRMMGGSGSDIVVSPELKKIFPFEIECKRHEDKTWQGTYKKSFDQTFNRNKPLLIRRKNLSRNHYFAYTKDILDIHPSIFRGEEKIIPHLSLSTFAKTNKTCLQIYSGYIHFNDKKFIEILSCLKKYYSQ